MSEEKKANEGIKEGLEAKCLQCGKFYPTTQKPSLCEKCFVQYFKKLK